MLASFVLLIFFDGAAIVRLNISHDAHLPYLTAHTMVQTSQAVHGRAVCMHRAASARIERWWPTEMQRLVSHARRVVGKCANHCTLPALGPRPPAISSLRTIEHDHEMPKECWCPSVAADNSGGIGVLLMNTCETVTCRTSTASRNTAHRYLSMT